jgi:glucosyl-dolichyl phosphate glucuronosyltransferase
MNELSLIICTFNRARSIERALESLSRVHVPQGLQWEVVLVDNRSTDSTPKVLRTAAGRLKAAVRVVNEEVQGVPYAWNRGLMSAGGKIIMFADDDVTFERNWLTAACEAFRDSSVQVVQGRIDLVLPEPPPSWLNTKWATTFLGHFGEGQSTNHLVGANFGARSEVFNRVGDFDLGIPNICDTAYSKRVIEAGYSIHYVPEMRVDHHMPRNRFVASRFIRQNYWWGRSTPQLESTNLSPGRYARWLTRDALGALFMASWSLLGGQTMNSLKHLCRLSNRVGILRSLACDAVVTKAGKCRS